MSIGILGYGLLAFSLGVRYLPLFTEQAPEGEEEDQTAAAEPLTAAVGGD